MGALGKLPAEGSHHGLCPTGSDFAWMEVSWAESLAGAKVSPALPSSPRRLVSSEKEMRWSSSGQTYVGLFLISQWYQAM